ncbi:fimbrial protein [Erwinia tasmaniensis]|uniref:fimbrial protein n=1 Tax=Erwinia tasmaniensis TaxID=338565 RepID=UPI003A4DC6C3
MKKKIYALALLTTLSGVAHAADGTIQFKGEIIDTACTVSPQSANQIVTMGQVSDKAFRAAGDTASATAFYIDLANCPASAQSASVKFDGSPYEGDNTTLALTETDGAATGVGIQIRNADNSPLPLFTRSQSITLTESKTNRLNFSAVYIAKASTVTAGPADATATFSVVYN